MRVIVMGGSLGGLTAALVLRDAGCDVVVYERSASPLEGRGAGIVLHPTTIRYLTANNLRNLGEIGAAADKLRYLDRTGAIVSEQPCNYRFSSYSWLHQALLDAFDPDRYYLNARIVQFEQQGDEVAVALADGRTDTGHLLVCADGVHSMARQRLLPEVIPQYAGYVGWRGTVRESSLTRESFIPLRSAITYAVLPNSHILSYPIPDVDGSLDAGNRLTNWVWYRNVAGGAELDDLLTDEKGVRHSLSVAPGSVTDRHAHALRRAAQDGLPPPLAEIVCRTREPFVQAVYDIEVPKMALGHVCLIGDAAFTLRPHAAAGTAKAADDAWTLAKAIMACQGNVTTALGMWEPGQLELGRRVMARTREAGNSAQFAGTWRVGAPLPFGLYEAGDSMMPL